MLGLGLHAVASAVQHGSELTKQSIELAVHVSYKLCNF